LIIGDSNVGKTSIMLRIVRNEFDEYSMPTLGTGFKMKEIQFKDN
jgi:GTPase SAR1 family protein